MNRKNLLDALSTVAPAVSDTDLVPILACVHSDGKTLTAYNESLAIRIEYESDLQGSVNAERLLGFLSKSAADDVVATPGENEKLVLRIGGARLELGMLPLPDIGIFESQPELGDCVAIPLSEAVLRGLKLCLVSVGSGRLHPEHAGITLLLDENGLCFFGTDDRTISCYGLGTDSGVYKTRELVRLLPTELCRQIIRLGVGQPGVMYLTEDEVFVDLPEVGIMIYAKLQTDLVLPDFEAVIMKCLGADPQFLELPEGLQPALARALLLAPKGIAQASAFAAVGSTLTILSEEADAKLKDEVTLAAAHPECSFRADPKLIERGCSEATDILLTPSATIMSDESGQYLYLVSHYADAE